MNRMTMPLSRLAPLAALALAGALALTPAPVSAMDPTAHGNVVRTSTNAGRPTSCWRIISEQEAVRRRGASFWCGRSWATRSRAASHGQRHATPTRRSYQHHTASTRHSHRQATASVHARVAAPAAQPLHLPAATSPSAAWGGGPDVGSMLGLAAKFAIVLALLFLCLRVLRHVMPRLSGSSGGPGAMVLHSESIGEKQRVQLLDLEVRLVLIAVSGGATTVLSTIDDPTEMATLRTRYQHRPRARANAVPGATPVASAPETPETPAESVNTVPLKEGLAGAERPSVAAEAPASPRRPTFAEALASATRQALAGGAPRPVAPPARTARTGPARAPKPRAAAPATRATPARAAARVDEEAASLSLGRSLQALHALRLRAEQL